MSPTPPFPLFKCVRFCKRGLRWVGSRRERIIFSARSAAFSSSSSSFVWTFFSFFHPSAKALVVGMQTGKKRKFGAITKQWKRKAWHCKTLSFYLSVWKEESLFKIPGTKMSKGEREREGFAAIFVDRHERKKRLKANFPPFLFTGKDKSRLRDSSQHQTGWRYWPGYFRTSLRVNYLRFIDSHRKAKSAILVVRAPAPCQLGVGTDLAQPGSCWAFSPWIKNLWKT